MGGKADGINGDFFKDVARMSHSLSSVDNQKAARFMNLFLKVLQIFEAAAVDIAGGIDND